MLIRYFGILLIFTLVVLSSCKSSTEPGEAYKDPREMTWTCDTLFFPDVWQTRIENFLAFDSDNIYGYGYSSVCKNIWKYNGSKWSVVNTSSVGGFDIKKMLGFSQTDIYGFGQWGSSLSKIIRYNGALWTEYTSAGTVEARLLTACADKSTNIYAAGDNGWILYFNGTAWQKDQIKMYVPSGGSYFLRSSAVWKDTTFFTAYKTDNRGREVYYLIKGKYKNWAIADSMVIDNPSSTYKWGWWGLYVAPDNKLISYGVSGIWEYNGMGWNHILTTVNSVRGVFSMGTDYTFTAGALNEVYFYNGSVWTKLDKFRNDNENIIYTAVWGNGKELFVAGNTTGAFPQKALIWHGK